MPGARAQLQPDLAKIVIHLVEGENSAGCITPPNAMLLDLDKYPSETKSSEFTGFSQTEASFDDLTKKPTCQNGFNKLCVPASSPAWSQHLNISSICLLCLL